MPRLSLSRPHAVLAALVLAAAALLFAAPVDAACVGITGPANVYAETSCQNATWSVLHCACPFGTTPSYTWTIDGVFAGSGPSISQTYCPQTPATTFTVDVAVTVRCGRSILGSDTHSTFVSLCDNSGGTPICNG